MMLRHRHILPYRSSTIGSHFVHGGKGTFQNYNTDQKAAINKLKERGIDNETVYLFFVNDCKALKANDSPDVVNGYMPRGYQFGFIYNELNNFRTIAHEICHGAFHLKHTFDTTDYLAPECTTDNLMDYNDGKTLNHWQWKDIHQPKSVRFKWLQEEEGAEAWGEIGTKILCINDESVVATIRKYRYFYLPDGRIVDLEKYTPSGFYTEEDVTPNVRGALATIRINGYDQSTIFKTDENTKEHTVTSWGYKIGDAQAMKVLDVSKVLVENPAGIDAVRVFVSKDEVRIERNGVVVETLLLSNDCNCTYKQVESECDALLEKYANTPIMNSEVMRRAILANPCILKEDFMIHFAEQSLGKSEWMKDFDLVFGLMVNVAMLPAELEVLIPMLGEDVLASVSKYVAKKAITETAKKAGREFAFGCFEEFLNQTMFWMIEHPNDWDDLYEKCWEPRFNGTSDETAEFWESIVKGGLKRAASGLKLEKTTTILTCLSEFEISRYAQLVEKKSSIREWSKKVFADMFECGASMLAKKATDIIDRDIKEKAENRAIEIGIDNFNQWWTDCLSKVMDEFEKKLME